MASDTFLTEFANALLKSSPYKLLSVLAKAYGLEDDYAEEHIEAEPEDQHAGLVRHLRTNTSFICEVHKLLSASHESDFTDYPQLAICVNRDFEPSEHASAYRALFAAAAVKDSGEGDFDEIQALQSIAALLHPVATLTPGSTYAGWNGVDIELATGTPGQTEPLELALREALAESVIYVGVSRLARQHLDFLLTDHGEDLVRAIRRGDAGPTVKVEEWLTQQFTTVVCSHMHAPPDQAEGGARGDLAKEDVSLFNSIEDRRKVQTFKPAPVGSGAGFSPAAGSAPATGSAPDEDLESGSVAKYAVALVQIIHAQKRALTATLNSLTQLAEGTEGKRQPWLNLSTRTLDTLVKAMAHAYPCQWMPDEKRTAELVAEEKIRDPKKAGKEPTGKPYRMSWDGELGHEMFSIGTIVINFVMTELMDAGARVRCDVDAPPLFLRLQEVEETAEVAKVEEVTVTTADQTTAVKGICESKGSDEPEDQTKAVKGTSESKGSDEPEYQTKAVKGTSESKGSDEPQDCQVYVWKCRPDRCAVLWYAPSSMLWVHETKHKPKSHNDVAKVVTAFCAKARFDWAVLHYAPLYNGNCQQYREWLSQLRTTLTVLSENKLEVLEGRVSPEGVVAVRLVDTYNLLEFQQAARAAVKLRALGEGFVDTMKSRSTVKLMRMLEWCATAALRKLKSVFTLLVSSRPPSAPKRGTPDPSSGPGSQTPGPPGGGTGPNTGQHGFGAPKGGKGGKPGPGGHRSGGRRHTGHVGACTDEDTGGDHHLCRVYFQGEDQTPEEDARIRKACFDMVAMLKKGVKVQIIPGLHGWRYNAKLRRRVTAPACSVFWDDTYTIVYKVVKSSSGEDDMQRRMHEVKGSRVLPVKGVIELSEGRMAVAMPFTHTVAGEMPWGITSVAAFIKCGQQLLKALQCLHEAGYYHRDIKPANLANDALMDVDLVLLDVGLAVHFPTAGKATLLQRTGTEGYMAPELGSQPFSAASEVYSAGITLSKLWAGIWDEWVDEPEALADTLAAMTEADSSKRPSLQQLLASSFFACAVPAPVSPESASPSSQGPGQASPTILFTAEPRTAVSR